MVSLEDQLMRVFGGDRIKSLMGTFKIPEDQAIENWMISRQLEGAQARIEGFVSIRVSRCWRTTTYKINSAWPS